MKRQNKIIVPIMLAVTLALTLIAGTTRQMAVSAESQDINIEGIVGQYTLDEESMSAVIYEVSRETGEMIDEGIAEKEEANKESDPDPSTPTTRDWTRYGSRIAANNLTSAEAEFYSRLSNLSQYYLDNSTIDAYYVSSYSIYAINGVRYNDLGLSSAQAFYVAQWFLYNNPQYYFLKPVFLTTSSAVYIGCYDVAVDGDDRALITSQIFETVDYLVDTVASVANNDYETEKYLHDIVCGHLNYKSGPYDQSIYSALVQEETVCAGYAGLMTVLCSASDIDVVTSLSKVHAWNEVYLDGEWYGVDATWDDSLGQYYFFNVCDANLKKYDSNSAEHTIETSWVSWTPVLANHDYQSEEVHHQDIELTTPELNVFADDDPMGFRVNWTQVPDASGYEICVYKDANYSNVGLTKNVTTLQVHFTGKKDGQVYYFTVRAYRDLNGECYYSDYAYGSYECHMKVEEPEPEPQPEPEPEPEPQPVDEFSLAAPTNLSVSDVTTDSIRFNWSAVENATKYRIELYHDVDCTSYIASGATSKLSMKISGLQPEQTIYAKICAYAVHDDKEYYSDYVIIKGQAASKIVEEPKPDESSNGEGDAAPSQPAQNDVQGESGTASGDTTTTPDAPPQEEEPPVEEPTTVAMPTDLNPTEITETSVKLVWNGVSDATSYDIQISRDSSFTSLLAQGSTSKVKMNVKGLSEGTTYYARIRSVKLTDDDRIVSDWISTSWMTTTDNFAVPTPTNIVVTDVTSNTAHISWDAIPNATYRVTVKRLMDSSETGGAVGGYKTYYDDVLTTNSTDIIGLDADRSYFIFVVASVDYKGKTYVSDCPMATFVTLPEQKEVITEVKAPATLTTEDITTSSARLVWDSVPDATYQIQISKVADYSSVLASGNTTKVRMNIKGLAENTKYYARVKSILTVDGKTLESDWICTSFITATNKVSILVPQNVTVSNVSDTAVRIAWETAGDDCKYEFGIYADANHTKKLGSATTAKLAMKVSGLQPGQTYYVCVRTVKGDETSDWVNIHFIK